MIPSEKQRGVCFGSCLISTSPHRTCLFLSSLPPQHLNASTQTANAPKMAGRMFKFCKGFVGICPDPTDTDSTTDTDSSIHSRTNSTSSSGSSDAKVAGSREIKVAVSPAAKAARSFLDKYATNIKLDDNNTDSSDAKVALEREIKAARSPAAKAARSFVAKYATNIKPDDNDTNLSDAKGAVTREIKAARSPAAKAARSFIAKAATDVKPDDNDTAATLANKNDAMFDRVNSTAQAAIEAWYAAELARLEARLATADARLIGLAADLARVDCAILKKEQKHSMLYEQLSSLHEAYSKRHEELTKQNQELERVVEKSQPGAEAEMALLLLYLSRAAVDISGTAKEDAEKYLRQADLDWEAYKRGYPLDDGGDRDASDAGGAEQDAEIDIKASSETDI